MGTLKRMLSFVSIGLLLSSFLSAFAVADDKPVIKIGYVVGWDDTVVTSNVVAKIITDRLGYQTQLVPVDAGLMWQGVARGDLDVTLAACLPVTHASYWQRYKSQVVDLGPNFVGQRIGFVVPDYVEANSIQDLVGKGNQFQSRIVGIDPGAGIMLRAAQAINTYDLKGYRLIPSSGSAMTAELARAEASKAPIIVTGWSPHWMFEKYKLKFLADPQKSFGDDGHVDTVVNAGFEKKAPPVVAFLRKFRWKPGEIDALLLAVSQGEKPVDVANAWLTTHPDRVNDWTRQ